MMMMMMMMMMMTMELYVYDCCYCGMKIVVVGRALVGLDLRIFYCEWCPADSTKKKFHSYEYVSAVDYSTICPRQLLLSTAPVNCSCQLLLVLPNTNHKVILPVNHLLLQRNHLILASNSTSTLHPSPPSLSPPPPPPPPFFCFLLFRGEATLYVL